MTQEEIEKKAYEAYPISNGPDEEFQEAKRDAYIQALTKIEKLPKIKGWVARDKNGSLYVFHDIYPRRLEDEWVGKGASSYIGEKLLPDITWESDPVEIELLIRRV